MIKLPKCKSTPGCEKISYMIKKTAVNPLKRDTFICSTCMITTYSAEHCEPIPQLKPINECLGCAEYNVSQISEFKDQNNLDDIWNGFLPDLNHFKETCIDLRTRFKEVEVEGQWWNLVQLQSDARDFLNLIFESDLMKHYNRQLLSRSFQASKRGVTLRDGDTQAFLRKKLMEIEDKYNTEQIEPLKEKLQKAAKEISQKNDQLQALQQSHSTITSLTAQNTTLTNQLTTTKTQLAHLQKSLAQSSHSYSHDQLKSLYKALHKKAVAFNADSSVRFSLDKANSVVLMKALQVCRLPRLKSVIVDQVGKCEEPKVVNRFLKNALSSDITQFSFYSDDPSFPSITTYMPSLKKSLPCIPQEIYIFQFTISKSQFEDIIIASQTCSEIGIFECRVDTTKELSFRGRLSQASFQRLCLGYTGSSAYSNWKKDGFKQFRNIAKGLAEAEPDRAFRIYVGNCEMEKEVAEKILKEAGMEKVIVEVEDD
ncbi:unnamed protein product [Moneuplotes crassus]|uniref:Uncharacterized protein n=1 Tax=Euplotes crassus TaxID=5936 RepID=A0AAD1X7I5_EUPCR|nr:unnamed protein product [Moneuplotes crassus]